MRTTLLFLLLLFPVFGFAQHEQSVWYFGQGKGLDFSNGPLLSREMYASNIEPLILDGGSMTASGGGATMADASGNLLFYTDGVQVWNKNHQLMTNGTGLQGNPDVTQTVLIVPRPLHRHRYYIFTTDARKDHSPNALRYSEVDMNLQRGLGEVIQKNVLLLTDVAEKITAKFHKNNQDFWLLTHTWNTNAFHAFIVDSTGINTTARVSEIGSVYSGPLNTGRGSFRVNRSYDASQVVVALPDHQIFETFWFDAITGQFTHFRDLSSLSSNAAYAEFSNWTRLYSVSVNGDEVFEYELNSGAWPDIISSARSIAKGAGFGDLRLARNGLVYVVSKHTGTLHSIEYNIELDLPVSYNRPSIYKADVVHLQPSGNLAGLPNTIASYAMAGWGGGYWGERCYGDTISFKLNFPNSVDSVLWHFDDPDSGDNNYSRELNPRHVFKTPGRGRHYDVKVAVFARGTEVEIDWYKIVTTSFVLGADTAFCFQQPQAYTLAPNTSDLKSYKWQDGSTKPTYEVTKPGTYWLEGTYPNNCTYRSVINISVSPLPIINLGNDTTMCTGKTLLLNAGNDGSTYLWQDGSVQPYFTVSEPGLYHVTVTNAAGCTASDSIKVYYLTPPAIYLGADTSLCEGTEILLDATLPGVHYIWQDGSTNPTFNVTQPGTYWVDASIDICTARDYIVIRKQEGCIDGVFIPNVITPNGDGLNDFFVVLDADITSTWHIEIINRHGILVYQSEQYNNTWNASGLSAGTYYFSLRSSNGKRFKGSVQVLR